MYTLRTFTETSEVNIFLGNQYEVIMRNQSESYSRFCELFKQRFEKDHVSDSDPSASEETIRCYAFVINDKDELIGIFKNQKNYIVGASGKTFSNLTHK